MRLRFFPLAAVLLCAASAAAHPVESCAAQAPAEPQWTLDQLATLGTTVVYETEEGGALVTSYRRVWSLDGAAALSDFSRWEAGDWAPVSNRDLIEFADPDRHDVSRYTFLRRESPADPFVGVQRDVIAYDAEGRMVSDTRQDWTGSEWVDNRRAVYERHPSGAFQSIRFERWTGGAWALDYRTTTAFEGDRRVLCEYFDTDDAGAEPYRRYRTHYAPDGRPAAVVRENFGDNAAPDDSSAYVYDAEGRYEALERYERTAAGWLAAERTRVVFDAEGAVVELRTELPTWNWDGWRDAALTTYTYRADGLLGTRTFELFVNGAWSTRARATYTSERQATDRAAPLAPALAVVASPNPTAGLAEARLTLSHAGPLRVDVYDVAGRRVARAHDGAAAAGSVQVPLDLRGLPAGLYLVVARTEAGRSTATLTLAR